MKILIVNKFLHPNGGSETYVFELGRQLAEMGYEIEYFGMDHKERIVGNHMGCYVSNMDFHARGLSKLKYPFKIIYSAEAKKKIMKVLEDFRPDVVHLNNFNFQLTPSIIYGVKEFERKTDKKVRLFFTAHDYQLLCPNHMMKNFALNENCERCLNSNVSSCIKYRCIHGSLLKSFLGSIEAWIYRKNKIYRFLDVIICPSHFMEEKMKKYSLFNAKTVMMHNFVQMRECEGIEKKRYVLYFGRYSEEKGVGTLLEACKRLPDVDFIFAGTGPLENEVNRLENIFNSGFLEGEKLIRTISEAAFSICPSEWYENCPFSVMESIVCKTPVIGAFVGGIPELIEQGRTGELFESGDVEELCKKIIKLWDNEEILDKYYHNCSKIHFDTVEEYCDKLLKLYNSQEGNEK